MIIDYHVHAGHADGLTRSQNTCEDIAVSLRRIDAAGIDKAVVLPIGASRSTTCREQNREVAEIVRSHRDRLFGFAKVSQLGTDIVARQIQQVS
ncbi:MAG: hypothetical protein NTW86_08625 [Candidatus Sumerlaeota bacterium]|nr:hypothetical protein [Candidatus Sumerlaeota bacterium]